MITLPSICSLDTLSYSCTFCFYKFFLSLNPLFNFFRMSIMFFWQISKCRMYTTLSIIRIFFCTFFSCLFQTFCSCSTLFLRHRFTFLTNLWSLPIRVISLYLYFTFCHKTIYPIFIKYATKPFANIANATALTTINARSFHKTATHNQPEIPIK